MLLIHMNFQEYLGLYPEYQCIFIGDNGQGDVRAAEMVLDDRIRDWVKVHYEKVNDQDPPELKVLKISDSLN